MKSFLGCCMLFVASLTLLHAQGMTTGGKVRHARDLPELVASFSFTFDGILTEEEKTDLNFLDPRGVLETDPELYERISQNIRRWTEDWIEYAAESLETVPEKRLERAHQMVGRVDELMSTYFAEHEWSYRKLRVVFLPQRLLEGRSSKLLGGFIPFYPDVFFSTVDPSAPLELVVVHESLHYNARCGRYGPRFVEGLTDAGAHRLAARYELLSAASLRKSGIYQQERGIVKVVVERLAERTGQSEGEALEVLLEAYLTDDDSRLIAAFGAEAWEAIVELSWTRKWRKSDILKALG